MRGRRVQPQSETVWRQADKYNIPRIAYINKMDRIGADFYRAYNMIYRDLGKKAVAIQLPIGAEDSFQGILDLIQMKAFIYVDELGLKVEERDLTPGEMKLAEEWRGELIERMAELDEEILNLYLEEQPIEIEQIKRSLRRLTLSSQLVPVLCGSSFRNKGVQRSWMRWLITCLPIGGADGEGIDPRTEEVVTRRSDVSEPEAPWRLKSWWIPMWGDLPISGCIPGS